MISADLYIIKNNKLCPRTMFIINGDSQHKQEKKEKKTWLGSENGNQAGK